MHTRRDEMTQHLKEKEAEIERIREELLSVPDLREVLALATDKYCRRCGSQLYIVGPAKKIESVVKTRPKLLAEDMCIRDMSVDKAVNHNGGSDVDLSEAAVTYTCLDEDCDYQGLVVVMWTTSPSKKTYTTRI